MKDFLRNLNITSATLYAIKVNQNKIRAVLVQRTQAAILAHLGSFAI